MDLAAFLKARLDEDEVAAKETAAGKGLLALAFAEHSEVPRKLGERMLRDVAAKRAIMLALEAVQRRRSSPGTFRGDPDEVSYTTGENAGLLIAAENLAAVYSGHPDYDPEWAI